MSNTRSAKPYFSADDFRTVDIFGEACWRLYCAYDNHVENIHMICDEIVTEILNRLKLDSTRMDKIAYLNVAITSPLFSSRYFGAAKRGFNSLFSGGVGSTDNSHPFFRSDSQERLMTYRDQLVHGSLDNLSRNSFK